MGLQTDSRFEHFFITSRLNPGSGSGSGTDYE